VYTESMKQMGRFRRPKWQAFTLIEVLVVCAIMVMLATMLIAGYVRFNQKRKVEAAALDFATFLRTQQKKANSGDLTGCVAGTQFLGYYVKVDTSADNQTATYQALCNATAANYKLKNDTFFEEDFSVTFLPLSHGATLPDGETVVSKGTNRFSISVDKQGAILVQAL